MDPITEEDLLESFADWERWDLFASDSGRRLWTRSGHVEYRVEVDRNKIYQGRSFEIAARVFSEPYGNYRIQSSNCPNRECEKPLVETLHYPPMYPWGDPQPATLSLSMTRVNLRCWSCGRHAQIATWGDDRDICTNISGTSPSSPSSTPQHRST